MAAIARRNVAAAGGALLLIPAPATAFAERTVTDQVGREVHLPDTVSRAVILQHQTSNIAVQLDAMGKVVGVLAEWKKQLGLRYARPAPMLPDLPMPGGATKVDVEEPLSRKPDVAFVMNHAPADMVGQIAAVGIPVVEVSLLKVDPMEAVKLNPTIADEPKAYDEGFRDGTPLIAEVLGRRSAGEAPIEKATENRKPVLDRPADPAPADRVPVYRANPAINTYGRGRYAGLMMERPVRATSPPRSQATSRCRWRTSSPGTRRRSSCRGAIRPWSTRSGPAPPGPGPTPYGTHRVVVMPEYARAWG